MRNTRDGFLSLQNPDFTFKKWEDLDITDDFIFSQVVFIKQAQEVRCYIYTNYHLQFCHKDNSYQTKKYTNVFFSVKQEEKNALGSHGIRMDIYLKGEDKIMNAVKCAEADK